MNEIDFLPEWYKSGKRRQVSRRLQYALVSCILAVMIIWNVNAGYSISQARAQLEKQKQKNPYTKNVKQQYHKLKSEVAKLQQKADFLERLDSRIDVTNILGEISFLTDNKIVLSDLRFQAEKLKNKNEDKSKNNSAVRVAGRNSGITNSLPLGQVRFKIIIKGIASQPGDVANLVCELEKSHYFRNVSSSLKNKQLKDTTDLISKVIQVTEFQIQCYLANYKLEARLSENK